MLNSEFTLQVNRVAKGGASLGAAPDGRTVFVTGTIPGETVTALATKEQKSFIEAATISVEQASADRIAPKCSHVAEGCGGCDWQHIEQKRQSALRREIVQDCLQRLAKIEGVPVDSARALPGESYRTTVRVAVENGKAAYRKANSHDLVSIEECLVAHPLIEEIILEGSFGSAREAVVRVGANTGERLLIVDPKAEGVKVPEDVKVVGRNQLSKGKKVFYHEEINGKILRISANSFFQCRPDGAQLLAELAAEAIKEVAGTLLDAYCGVGLFGVLCGGSRKVIGVESATSSVADAKVNYGDRGKVIKSKVEDWVAQPVAAVIADPARQGLKKLSCEQLVRTNAKVIVLISCDPASLARDAALLQEKGYNLERVTVADLFGQTSHIETVSKFVRSSSKG